MNDVFGKSLSPLLGKKVFLLDMDGTIYLDHTVIEGTRPFLDRLARQGKRALFITNNSSRSVLDYVEKLAKMGISATPDDFFTSSMGMAMYLNQNFPGKRVYCMGTQSLIAELVRAGIPVTTDADDGVEVVALGYDTELTYKKLSDVSRLLLQKDLPYLATNPDYVCPVWYGFAPDCGAMAEMLRHAVKRMPKFIGKPDPMILLQALRKFGFAPGDAVVVGDRLYTDIQSGVNAGITTVAVLSGESSLEDVLAHPVKPDFTIPSVMTLADLLGK